MGIFRAQSRRQPVLMAAPPPPPPPAPLPAPAPAITPPNEDATLPVNDQTALDAASQAETARRRRGRGFASTLLSTGQTRAQGGVAKKMLLGA